MGHDSHAAPRRWLPANWLEVASDHIVAVSARPSSLPASLDSLLDLLNEPERQRVGRLHRAEDRLRSVVGTAIARTLLAEPLGVHPRDVPLQRTATGKPMLADSAPVAMNFSISHSGDIVLVAVSRLGRVGVDVEVARPLDDLASLAASAFSARECHDVMMAHSAQERLARFYRVWTRKESMAKALGIGLMGLDRIVCDAAADTGNALLGLEVEGEDSRQWTVQSLVMPGHDPEPAAVSFEGCPRGVVLFTV
jgi:4'-phosphopantetheinyl transferase